MSCELSLHRNRFGQVAGLIHIQMFADGSIIGNQLQGHCNGKHGEAVFQVRYPKFYISHSILHHRLFLGQKDDISTPGLYLPDIGNGLGKYMVLSCNGYDRHIVINQGNGSVLQFTGSIRLCVDIGDFLKLKGPFQGKGVIQAPSNKKGVP